jgi:hypothetical protein
MRAFRNWLVLACGIFGLTAWGYHAWLQASPKKVLVIVDGSYPMAAVWDQIPPLLRSMTGARYTLYALATDKGLIHSWQPKLELNAVRPYAPRQLTDLPQRLQVPERAQATKIELITNAAANELPTGTGWRVLRLGR